MNNAETAEVMDIARQVGEEIRRGNPAVTATTCVAVPQEHRPEGSEITALVICEVNSQMAGDYWLTLRSPIMIMVLDGSLKNERLERPEEAGWHILELNEKIVYETLLKDGNVWWDVVRKVFVVLVGYDRSRDIDNLHLLAETNPKLRHLRAIPLV